MHYNELSYFEKVEGVPARICYHYTSIYALFEIVKNRTFWLTNLKSSNDKKELQLTFSDYCKKVKKIQEVNKKGDVGFCDFIGQLLSGGERFSSEITKLRKAITDAYALSLVGKKDNLLHWNSYAEKGTGVCIAFNVNALDVYVERMVLSMFGNNLLSRGNVVYGETSCLETIEKMLKHYYDMYQNDEEAKQLWQRTDSMGYVTLWIVYDQAKNFAKHESFFDESEYRLFFAPYSIKETKHVINSLKNDLSQELMTNITKHFNDFIRTLEIEKKNFCLVRDEIRSYHKLHLGEIWGQGVIPEIIVGPKM